MKEMAMYNFLYHILEKEKSGQRLFKGFVIHTGNNKNE